MENQLQGQDTIREFILGGMATFTIRSQGQYRIRIGMDQMNNLQLFRMYKRFRDEREDTETLWVGEAPNFLWVEWKKWNHLARMTRMELERRLGSQSLTGQNLVTAFGSLFDGLEPETPEEIDAALREAGYDPDELGARIKAAADQALRGVR